MRISKGFTLIELAIVLVIIGLLIGGVLAGQELIHQAKLRNIISERDNIIRSFVTFKLKYNAIPGDLKNATSFWGTHNSDPILCATTPSTDIATCDGDGNGNLKHGEVQTLASSQEQYRAWQHLTNANLLAGFYNGAPSAGVYPDFGTNAPKSKFTNAGWSLWYSSPGTEAMVSKDNQDILVLGSTQEAPTLGWGPVLTSEEAYSLDGKMDDGKPNSDDVFSFIHGSESLPNCVVEDNDAYQLNDKHHYLRFGIFNRSIVSNRYSANI